MRLAGIDIPDKVVLELAVLLRRGGFTDTCRDPRRRDEVEIFVPGERLVMSTAEGPFPMKTTYTWSDTPDGGTHMTLRNRGEPSGFAKIATSMMASAVRRANRKDLARLKQTIESGAAPQETE